MLFRSVTLKHWLRRAKRPWTEVLAVFLQAGRGLAAAHAAGLIHRDFKPDNVLVGKDGRVRVADFGLARVLAGVPDSEEKLSVARMVSGAPATEVIADTCCDDIAFWLYSSGSTGSPKGTVHLHSHLIQTAELYARAVLGIREGRIPGKTGVLAGLTAAGAVVLGVLALQAEED